MCHVLEQWKVMQYVEVFCGHLGKWGKGRDIRTRGRKERVKGLCVDE